jgi:hypothetical protein
MCFVGYSQDDVNYVSELKKLKGMGFDKALVYPVTFFTYSKDFKMGGLPSIDLSLGDIEEIKSLGYEVCPWSWVNEALEGIGYDDGCKINRKGERILGWQIDDFKWNKLCSTEIERFTAKLAENEAMKMTWDHFDVLTCGMNGECYDLNHERHLGRGLSRSEDMDWLKKILVTAQGKGMNTRAVSSESFNDFFSVEYDLGSVKAWPQYGPWCFWPVPLTGLVYHDSIMHTWWEVHNYNSPYFCHTRGDRFQNGGGRPDLQSALDALMGCPPDVMPFGAQYGWTGRGRETFTYRYRLEDEGVQYALKKALPVAKLHERIGMQEMVGFKFLSDDGWVQETTFADGTRVLANFSHQVVRNVPDVGMMMPESWVALDRQ